MFPPPLLTTTTQRRRTPLHLAALEGHVAACTTLLEAGAAVDAQNEVCGSVRVCVFACGSARRICFQFASSMRNSLNHASLLLPSDLLLAFPRLENYQDVTTLNYCSLLLVIQYALYSRVTSIF